MKVFLKIEGQSKTERVTFQRLMGFAKQISKTDFDILLQKFHVKERRISSQALASFRFALSQAFILYFLYSIYLRSQFVPQTSSMYPLNNNK